MKYYNQGHVKQRRKKLIVVLITFIKKIRSHRRQQLIE